MQCSFHLSKAGCSVVAC